MEKEEQELLQSQLESFTALRKRIVEAAETETHGGGLDALADALNKTCEQERFLSDRVQGAEKETTFKPGQAGKVEREKNG